MSNRMTAAEELAIVRRVADMVVESVRIAGPLGMPGGSIYAALMSQGCTLAQFEAIMGALVATGQLRKSGQLYFVVLQ